MSDPCRVLIETNNWELSMQDICEQKKQDAIKEMVNEFLAQGKKYKLSELFTELIEDEIQKEMPELEDNDIVTLAQLSIRLNEREKIFNAVCDNSVVMDIAEKQQIRAA